MALYNKKEMVLAVRLLDACKAREWKLAVAESCTGGLVCGLLTEVPGSSAVFDRGFITYSNKAKQTLLGVPAVALKRYGAVSQQVAKHMALGGISHSDAQVCIAITGIAGPGGGTKAKPVGLVYIAVAAGKRCVVQEYHFKGTRSAIRVAAVTAAMEQTIRCV